jgi:repressor of nif and glnA expression
MGKEERMEMVLQLLHESELALPPGVIFRNLKSRGATFERRTLGNYLDELQDEGLVIKVDPDELEKGNIAEIDTDETGYYILTTEGEDRLE